ncbi:gliding motility lipoprotein GldH [uncultured Psychroserpens sp.]|uniref:gliding motility lipoprotein GldH n=1 Tax=uncultured Psychroserpens sp. TaxID=255436 RepID=UPI002635A52C|nr:gliding motility lipoprotein GldH [uncultured Psychroserpens sp.]
MQKNKYWFIGLLIVIITVSCDANRVFDEYKSVPDQWDKNNVIEFKVTPPDSTSNYNLFVNLRNTEDFKYSNLFLIVELNYPNGKTLVDTLEYAMTNPDGTFLGTGFTDVKENKLWYKGHKTPFVFNEQGEYTINIQQAMRQNGSVDGIDKLEGITDVGFRIEHAQTP